MNEAFCRKVHQAWTKAFINRRGDVCVFGPNYPAYILDPQGYGRGFCDRPGDRVRSITRAKEVNMKM